MAIRVTRSGVGLAVGIIVVAALVFGGFWLVKERGEQARRDEAIKVADQKLQDESNKEVALQSDASQTEPEKQAAEEKAAEEEAAKEEPVKSETAETQSQGAQALAVELPQTGPAENTFMVIILALLAFTGASYLRSRRALRDA